MLLKNIYEKISNWLPLKGKHLSRPRRPLISPGDIADKITILFIKIRRIEDPDRQEQFATELLFDIKALKEWRRWKPDVSTVQLDALLDELRGINEVQWDLEDQVRLGGSLEAAQAARRNNTKRVEVKNMINEVFGWFLEVKEYKGE